MPKPKRGNKNTWNKAKNSSANGPRPAGLSGKALGLYYRDRARERKAAGKPLREFLVHFTLPASVEKSVENNLLSIIKLAERFNIPLVNFKSKEFIKLNPFLRELLENETSCSKNNDVISVLDDVKKENLDMSIESEDEFKKSVSSDDFKKPVSDDFKVPQVPVYKIKKEPDTACSSSTSDFIPIEEADQTEYVTDKRLLSLRGGGDYKYGYEDIITGTFDEKLDESLSKGVSINMTTEDITAKSADFYEEYKQMLSKTGYKRMKEFRVRLPTYKKTQELLDVINNNQVIVISGETGCGKSTQVPQIILDDAICKGQGANIKIVVTQPRRIAASSLAARVAQERAEEMGNSVGYAVRLEKIDARPRGSIMFVTTGILLADLEVNQGLVNTSHVILDEVHERDCDMDLSMCMLKLVLKKRKDLKLVLMSATIDSEKISEYFDNCPMIHIEGLAYPVKDIYLEDILEKINFQLRDVRKTQPNPNRHEPIWKKFQKKNQSIQSQEMEKQVQYRAEIHPWLESIKKEITHRTYRTLSDYRIEELNPELIVDLLRHICHLPPGAILVFLPGIGEISKVLKLMAQCGAFPTHRYEIYPLHSKLPSLDQRKIFERPPDHIRKIIVATNIAETSITIDDIVYVVDCGRLKLKGLNVEDNMTTLKVEWVSQANLRQRRGRAGRCQPGICYHLMTSYRASTLADRLLPELQRSDLLEPVLSIKRLRLGKAVEALKMTPSPPARTTIEWAVKHLQQCGALNSDEKLTPLGWHLARLPVHPAAGKLLLLGTLFGCLDRAASNAAVWGFKDPFQLVIGKEKEIDQVKRDLSLNEPSDHVVVSEAVIQWELCPKQRRHSFAYEHFLSHNTLDLLSEMKKQFGNNLKQMGWLPSGNIKSGWENRNTNNLSLFKAVVAAALYPTVVSVRWSKNGRNGGTVKIIDPNQMKMFIHPSSVLAGPNRTFRMAGGNWMVYWLRQKTKEVYLIELTVVYTLPLLFFGELKICEPGDDQDLHIAANEIDLAVSTAKVRCCKKTACLLFELRSHLDQVLAWKVMSLSDDTAHRHEFEEYVLNSVTELITAEDEGVAYLGDDSQSDSDQSTSGRGSFDFTPDNNDWISYY